MRIAPRDAHYTLRSSAASNSVNTGSLTMGKKTKIKRSALTDNGKNKISKVAIILVVLPNDSSTAY